MSSLLSIHSLFPLKTTHRIMPRGTRFSWLLLDANDVLIDRGDNCVTRSAAMVCISQARSVYTAAQKLLRVAAVERDRDNPAEKTRRALQGKFTISRDTVFRRTR